MIILPLLCVLTANIFLQQFESANSWLPTKRGLGPVGTFAAPEFVFASTGFSSTGVDAQNCMTVTLVSSITITSPAKNLVTLLTLSGLQSFSNPTSAALPLYVNRALCLAGTSATATLQGGFAPMGKWDREKGEIVVEISPGYYLVAGQVADFTVSLRSGSQPATNPGPKVSVSDGFYCKDAGLCDSADRFSMTVNAAADSSVSARRQRTFETTGPSFDTRKVHQSANDPGQSATISVTLKPNTGLNTGGKITLSGLCGTIANAATFTVTGPVTIETWDGSELKFITTSNLVADTDYVISWDWILLKTGQSACSVQVSASGSNTFPPQTMQNVGGTAGLVEAPKFISHKIGQYSTRPDATNYICVTLETNFDFKAGSKIELRGFASSQTESRADLPLYDCPAADLGSTVPPLVSNGVFRSPSSKTADKFDFNAEYPGVASMVVSDTNSIARRTPYVFAISLMNSAVGTGCQVISLVASGDIIQSVSMETSASDRAVVDGSEDGDRCPLRTYDPGFLVSSIVQTTFAAGLDNMLTISLMTNILLSSSSSGYAAKITFTGLTGSKTRSSSVSDDGATSLTMLAIAPLATNFMPQYQRADWNTDTGTLVLTLASGSCVVPVTAGQSSPCLMPGFVYAFTFTLVNGDKAQQAVQVTGSANYAVGGDVRTTKPKVLEPPTAEELAPLYIIPANQLLYKYKIGQTWPAPSARNAICVTLGFAQAVDANTGDRFTSFTISGLTGFDLDPQRLPLLATTDGRTPLAAEQDAHNVFGAKIGEDSKRNFVDFDSAAGEVKFFLVAAAQARTDYDFCFHVTNPDSEVACASKDVQISTRWQNEVLSLQMLQDKATNIDDYPSGSACAGYTAKRSFTRARLRGHSNVTNTVSSMICELVTNYELKQAGTLTISGLQGYRNKGMNADTAIKVLVSANGVPKRSLLASSDFTSDQLVLRLAEPMLAQDTLRDTAKVETVYVLTFELKNGDSAQEAPIIYIEASNGISRMIMETGRPEDANISSSLGSVEAAEAGNALSSRTSQTSVIAIVAGVLGGAAALAIGGYYAKTRGIAGPAKGTSAPQKASTDGGKRKGSSTKPTVPKPGAAEATLKPPGIEASTMAPINMAMPMGPHMGMPQMAMPPFGMPFR